MIHNCKEECIIWTKKGRNEVERFIRECEAKRKEILDAGLDTVDDTNIPTIEDIESDIFSFYDEEEEEYYNGWGVTDSYNSDYPLCLKRGKHFTFGIRQTCFTELQMKHRLYEFYKLDWLMSHGYTIMDIIDAMDEYFTAEDYEQPEEYDTGIFPTREDMLSEWEYESGFGGEIYACYGEFCDTELNDRDYIYGLLEKIGDVSLRTELRKAYTEYVKV